MLLPAGIIGIITFVNTEETKKYWQEKTDEEVLKAATDDIRKILPEVRPFVKDEAVKRGLIDQSSLEKFDKPKIYILMKNKWIACPVCFLISPVLLALVICYADCHGFGTLSFNLSIFFIILQGVFWLAVIPRGEITMGFILYIGFLTAVSFGLFQCSLVLLAFLSGRVPL